MTTVVLPRARLEALVVAICEAKYALRGERFADQQWMDCLRNDPLADPWEVVKQDVIRFAELPSWDITINSTEAFFWDGVEDEWHPEEPQVPDYDAPIWVDGRVTNGGGLAPLWSGKIAPPPVGAVVILTGSKRIRCTITGYAVEGDWLMAEGYRTDEPTKRGNLAGIEILEVEA